MADNSLAIKVVIPAYNEGTRLPDFLRELRAYLEREFPAGYEVCIVDDGSREGLAGALQELQRGWDELRVLTHPENLGKGSALRTGVLESVGGLVLLCDADGATRIEDEQLLRAAIDDGADIAVGSRYLGSAVTRHRTRRFAGLMFSRIVRTIFGLSVRDTQCGFKMLRGEVARSLFQLTRERGYLVDVEILLLAKNHGFCVSEIPITWREMPGSKVSLWKDSGPVVAGLWRLYRRSRR